MPVYRIVFEDVPIGTIFREGTPRFPVVYVVESSVPISNRPVFGNGGAVYAPRWKLKFRPPTEEEKTLSVVMQA